MGNQELARSLRRIRIYEGSMVDIALKMHQAYPLRKQATFIGVISFFEKGWAELGYALEGQEPWKTYFGLYCGAINLEDRQKKELGLASML